MRATATIPRNHGPNITCLAAVSRTGIHVPLAFEGALDGAFFAEWVRAWLVPILQPGQIVVLDHLSVHKHVEAREAIEAAGCTVRFLPPYSPDFNPIELAFAKLKTHLRGVGARSFETIVAALGDGLTAITTQDATGFYRHAGYA